MCIRCEPFIEQAEAFCAKQGLRLTLPRAQVLGIVVESAGPMTAYQILDQLGKMVKNPAPPTVYRALEFLQETGLVHRIESINAYVACHAGHAHGNAQFLICDDCGDVREIDIPHIAHDVLKVAGVAGFIPTRHNTEIHGQCADCGKPPVI